MQEILKYAPLFVVMNLGAAFPAGMCFAWYTSKRTMISLISFLFFGSIMLIGMFGSVFCIWSLK